MRCKPSVQEVLILNAQLVSIVRRFAMLAVSMMILVVGDGAQAAPQSRMPSQSGVAPVASPLETKVVHFNPSGIRGTLERTP